MSHRGRILIIGNSMAFPVGLAGSARVRCIAKVLIESGWVVDVVNLIGIAKEYSNFWVPPKGIYDGIHYIFCGGRSIRPSSKLGRLVEKLIGNIVCLGTVFYKKVRARVDCLILYSRDPDFIKRIGLLAKILKIPVIVEVCEWPEAIAATKKSGLAKAVRFRKVILKYFAAFLPISTYIYKKIHQFNENPNIKMLILPILFDKYPRYAKQSAYILKKPKVYMFYSGAADYENISKLVIDSIPILRKMGVKVPLLLTCPGSNESVNRLKNYISVMGLEKDVLYLGYLSEKAYMQVIAEATLLLAPLPNDLQSIARFPTKLGFYLASGKPVITSAVGEIGRYLKDGESAYVMPADFTSNDLANKICEAIENPEEAIKIGLKGKQVAFENFYYKNQKSKLSKFVDHVVFY